MSNFNMMLAFLLSALVLQLVGLTFAVLTDAYIEKSRRRCFLVIVLLLAVLIVQNLTNYQTDQAALIRERLLVSILGYAIRPVILLMFLHLVSSSRKHLAVGWALVGVNAAIHLTSLFSNICFTIDKYNHFYRGPLGYSCHIVSMLLLAMLVWRTIREYGRRSGRIIAVPLLNAVLIVAALAADLFIAQNGPINFVTVASVSEAVFYYIWLHLQFVQEHEDDLKAKQRIQIMLSQIQPHFLYNTLGAIKSTYYYDPELARGAIDQFTDFLRHNMDSLTDDQPISFEKELEHVRCYLDLLQLRFGDSLRVEYDLECTDFRIPTLTLQPLVENAVSYGVRKNPKGNGLVIIRTRELPESYEVSVIDNGPGFVPDNVPGDSERSHIGIQNVRSRLHSAIGAELTIRSEPGKGTAAVMILPKGKENA